MINSTLKIRQDKDNLTLIFKGKLSLHTITHNQKIIDKIDTFNIKQTFIQKMDLHY